MKKRIKKLIKSDSLKISLSLSLFALGLAFEFFGIKIVSIIFYVLALTVSGIEVFSGAVRGIVRLDPLDEKFLMSVAAIGAMIVGEWSEGCAVMIFYLIGESFEHKAVRKSRNRIKSLMDICPDEANILVDEKEITVDAEEVEVGSILVIRPGERVPLDCSVISGRANIDTSSMTGESLPISVGEGDQLLSGYFVCDGIIRAVAAKPLDESAASRVLALVEQASDNKSKEESFITRFSRYYTPIVVLLALLVAVIPFALGFMTIRSSIYTALTFLVISCPCALVISVPMAFFGGIGGAAASGILFKGGNVFSKMAKPQTVAFDKTGTITSGRFDVSAMIPLGITKDELAFIAASLESVSNHPIAECIKKQSEKVLTPSNAKELSGLGIVAELEGEICAVGNSSLMKKQGVDLPSEYLGSGIIYVAKADKLVGLIYISDSIKAEAKEAIKLLKRLGVSKTVILSGDREENVKKVSATVGIDEYSHSLSPEEKYKKLEELISNSSSTLFVGDGINDAPSLARADVGVAMGSIGQDSAIEASDLVIMTDNLLKLPEAVFIARKTVRIARENIIFALGIKVAILLLGFLGLANMWLAVFADVGVAVLAVLNSMRALKVERK